VHTKQVVGKTNMTNMRKSEKVHISITFLPITFLGAFFKTFSTDFKSAYNSAFFETHIEFLNKKISFSLKIYALFLSFECKCAGNSSKKGKPFL
jgi:hypothetical protein